MRTIAALAAVIASLVLVACGGSSDSVAMLDTVKVERAIVDSSLAQRGLRPRVSCPARVRQEEGLKFSCTALVGELSTRFVVIQPDDSGRVRFEARP